MSPVFLKFFNWFLLLRSFSIKESLKPSLSCSCSGTCSEFRASPLQRTCNWALQEYFSLFESLHPEQENWFESSFPAQQIISGCFETWKQHGRDGCPCVWQLGSAQGLCLGSSGAAVLCVLAQTAGTALGLRAEWRIHQFVLPAICLAASFLKELNAAELVLLTVSTVVYLAVK